MNDTILAGGPLGNRNAAGKHRRKTLFPEIAEKHGLEEHEIASANRFLDSYRSSSDFDRKTSVVKQAIDDHIKMEDMTKAVDSVEDNVIRAAGTSEGAKKGWQGRAHGVGDLVRFQIPGAGKIAGTVKRLLPDDKIEVKSQQHGYHILHQSEARISAAKQHEETQMIRQNLGADPRIAKMSDDEVHWEYGDTQYAQRETPLPKSGSNSGFHHASDTNSTEVIHCRASSAAGEKLATGAFPLVWQEA